MCQKALEKAYANFHASTPCAISGYSEAFGVPQSVLDEPARSACLEIKPGKMDTESGLYEGGPVFWVESRNDRVNRRQSVKMRVKRPAIFNGLLSGGRQHTHQFEVRVATRRDGRLQLRDVYLLEPKGPKMLDATVFTQ